MKVVIEIPQYMIEELEDRNVNPEFYESIMNDYVNHCVGLYYGTDMEDFRVWLDGDDTILDEYLIEE